MIKTKPFTKCNVWTTERPMILRIVNLPIPLCCGQLGTKRISASSLTKTWKLQNFSAERDFRASTGAWGNTNWRGDQGHMNGRRQARLESRPLESLFDTYFPSSEWNLVAQRSSSRTETLSTVLRSASTYLFKIAGPSLLPVHHVMKNRNHDIPEIWLWYQGHFQERANQGRDKMKLVLS